MQNRSIQWIVRAWRGEEKLWKVFFYPLAFWIVLNLISVTAGIAFFTKGQNAPPLTPTSGWITPLSAWQFMFFALLISIAIKIPATIWQTVAVWRCAFNVRAPQREFWGYLARALMLLSCLQVGADFARDLPTAPAVMGNKSDLFRLTCVLNMTAYYNFNFPHENKRDAFRYVDSHPDDLKECMKALADH